MTTLYGTPQTDDARAFLEMMQRTMDEFAAAWTRGDVATLMTLFGKDPVYRTSSGLTFKGRSALRDGLAKMCPPPSDGPVPPQAEGKMHFFGRCCLSYWTLRLPNGSGQALVDGVDVITFNEDAKVILKDAYRKLA